MRKVIIAACLVLLTGCSERGQLILDPGAARIGSPEQIWFGTTRKPDPAAGGFGSGRSEQERFGRYTVSVPPDHVPGSIKYTKARHTPDARKDFLTTEASIYPDGADFRRALSTTMRTMPKGRREAVIYVHGFNNTFTEGLYRIAQLSHDLDMPGATLHYSWPSAGSPLGYVSDRDSAMFARDGLEELIRLTAGAGADRIAIVAHSMGSSLVMETLRQIAIRGDEGIKRRISGVILISPDIDVDVFRMQARAYGDLPSPFLIFGSDRDTLLGLSARLTGQPERLGNLKDISRLADLEVTFLDTGAFRSGAGHFNMGDSPALLNLVSRMPDVDRAFGADQTGRTGLLPGVVLTVQRATQIVLSPVEALAN